MKKRVLIGVCLVGVFAAASALAARPDYWKPNYDKSKIAPYTLEDPLTFADGAKVSYIYSDGGEVTGVVSVAGTTRWTRPAAARASIPPPGLSASATARGTGNLPRSRTRTALSCLTPTT